MLHVTMLLSNRCNLRCAHCFSASGEMAAWECGPAERRTILARLRELGTEHVVFSGGEPLLLRDELYALVGAARDLGMGTSLLTNGIRLTHDGVEALERVGLERVAVSLYSAGITGFTEEAHSRYLFKVLSAVERLDASRIRYKVTIPVHRENRAFVRGMLRSLHGMGAAPEKVRLYVITPSGRGQGLSPTLLTAEEWAGFIDECASWRETEKSALHVVYSSYGPATASAYQGCPIREYRQRLAGPFADPHVSESGDLVLCGLLIREPAHVVANLVRESADQVRAAIRAYAERFAGPGNDRCPVLRQMEHDRTCPLSYNQNVLATADAA